MTEAPVTGGITVEVTGAEAEIPIGILVDEEDAPF